MRAYTVATVAATLGVTPKWLDNALSRFPVRGVIQSRQGVSRRLAPQAVMTLHLANELVRSTGIPLREALSLAERVQNSQGKDGEGHSSIELFYSAYLTIDLTAAATEISRRLAEAVEITPVPNRGRPPTK